MTPLRSSSGSPDVARLGYVAPGSEPEADRVFAEVQRLGRPILNLYAELANQPPALAAFLGMSRYIRDESSLEPGLRELEILASAHALGQEYEVRHHIEAAARAGVPPEKVAAVGLRGTLDGLTDRERCAVDYAREAAATRTCTDATFARMRALFSTEEVVDLVVTAAWYHLCAVILGTLEIELEEPRS
jgi:alkylhydroperoxidase family enzyme